MILINGDKEISTGCTPQGQFYVRTSNEAGSLIRTTRDPGQFLRYLFAADSTLKTEMSGADSAYNCSWCGGTFRSGQGVRILATYDFCMGCLGSFFHYEFFRTVKRMSDPEIWHITENKAENL